MPVAAYCYTNPAGTELQVWTYPGGAASPYVYVHSVDVKFEGEQVAVPVNAADPAGGAVSLTPAQQAGDVLDCTVTGVH